MLIKFFRKMFYILFLFVLTLIRFLRITRWPAAGNELSAMWENLIHTGLCRQTKFMYGINYAVQTPLCPKTSLLVFEVIFKFFDLLRDHHQVPFFYFIYRRTFINPDACRRLYSQHVLRSSVEFDCSSSTLKML